MTAIILAPQDAVDQFDAQIQRVLLALGHDEALVTDESQVFDFLPWTCAEMDEKDRAQAKDEERHILAQLEALLLRTVSGGEYLWALGRDLAALEEQQRQQQRPH
jgi:hypothetical protein